VTLHPKILRPIVDDDEKTVQDAEGQGRYGEKVHRRNRLVMVYSGGWNDAFSGRCMRH
jgi:hypothetical protein